jgi:hypothetical protein
MKFVMLVVFLFVPLANYAQIPAGMITGQIMSIDGKPIGGVRVGAEDIAETSEQASVISLGRTDLDGRFRLEGLPPGKYLIFSGAVASPTYYPGTDARPSAKPVTVVAGYSYKTRTPSTACEGEDFPKATRTQCRITGLTLSQGTSPHSFAPVMLMGANTQSNSPGANSTS